MAIEDEAYARKVAENESAFRSSNERLRRAAESYRFESRDRVPFVCECADEGCREIVMLSVEEYEHVRSEPTWFLLVAGHEDPEQAHERIIEAENGYTIVEKLGTAAAEVTRLDQRHSGDD